MEQTPGKRLSLKAETPNNRNKGKSSLLTATPGHALTIDRSVIKDTALNNPMFIEGHSYANNLSRANQGAKSTKSLSKMGDGLSTKSVYEPAVL